MIRRAGKIAQISRRVYSCCYDVEKNIVGHNDKDAALWAKANSIRHAHIIRAIGDYAALSGDRELRILNSSGIGPGHQDFSVVDFLRANKELVFSWEVLESPHSPYLGKDHFKNYIDKLKIKLTLGDFRRIEDFSVREGFYDVVLLTEIIEHLDHSVFLRLLGFISRTLKQGGIMIVTTPNLLSMLNRIRIFFGKGDGPYWGDGMKDLENNIYGHIVNYSIDRLNRIFRESGFSVLKDYSYEFGYGPGEKSLKKRIGYKMLALVSCLFKNSAQSIFMICENAVSLDN